MGCMETCPRGRNDCVPLNNVVSDEEPLSFVCVGYNDGSSRQVEQDRFTHCWKNAAIDERGHWDRRDLIDTAAVMMTALSVDENIRVSEGLTDDEMNKVDFLAG